MHTFTIYNILPLPQGRTVNVLPMKEGISHSWNIQFDSCSSSLFLCMHHNTRSFSMKYAHSCMHSPSLLIHRCNISMTHSTHVFQPSAFTPWTIYFSLELNLQSHNGITSLHWTSHGWCQIQCLALVVLDAVTWVFDISPTYIPKIKIAGWGIKSPL